MNQLNYPLDLIQQIDLKKCINICYQIKNNGEGIQMVLLEKLGKPNVYHVEKNILKQSFKQLQLLVE